MLNTLYNILIYFITPKCILYANHFSINLEYYIEFLLNSIRILFSASVAVCSSLFDIYL